MSHDKKIAIINSHATYQQGAGKEALDVALIFGSYEQTISLFFHGDGVFQLVDKQLPESIEHKNYLKTFSAFELYDIDSVYVCQHSLTERNLSESFHIPQVNVLTQSQFNELLSQHDVILRF